jgi:hypothetical protein
MRLSARKSKRDSNQARHHHHRAGTLARSGEALAEAQAGRSPRLLPTRLRVVGLIQREREGGRTGPRRHQTAHLSIGLNR